MLSELADHGRLVLLGFYGFVHLPLHSNSKFFGYNYLSLAAKCADTPIR
ncbi:MAG: hypothetical protein QS721_10930 [Candidatus Endonucleobacter sp. (ex Gigantidas childressi)]|nr:hypothetical protein [Candidatus Endonucleobacter sp. (ex Gigantidas childressi)]